MENTIQRYLEAVQTFTPHQQLEKTKSLADQFLGDKQKIQAIMDKLSQRQDTEESWVKPITFTPISFSFVSLQALLQRFYVENLSHLI